MRKASDVDVMDVVSVRVTGSAVTWTVSVATVVSIRVRVDTTDSVETDVIVLAGRVTSTISVTIDVIVSLLVSVWYSVKVMGATEMVSVSVIVSMDIVVNVSVIVLTIRGLSMVNTGTDLDEDWSRLIRWKFPKLIPRKLRKLVNKFWPLVE